MVCRLTLGLERLNTSRGRKAVERHIDKQGVPAGCGRTGSRLEAFPFGSARIVEVYMGINQARENGCRAEILELCLLGDFGGRENRSNPLPFDEYRSGADSFRMYHARRQECS